MAPAVAEEAIPVLDEKVDDYLSALATAQPKSPEFAAQAENVRTMGDADIRKAAETSNRLLERPVQALKKGGLAEGSEVGKTLLELRRTVEDLDPSQLTGTRKLLGIIPFGDKVVDYFRRYQSAQSQLNGILHSLRNGQDELQRDNVALNMEKTNLWAAMGRLNQYVYIAERLDAKLSARIAELQISDPETAKALNQDVLFYVRQKHQDLLTQLAVSIQSYLAIDIIIKNNVELIKGVDRASTTTISALRTAVIVAQALGNQKLVLDQIAALNTTTSGMIERTSEMLKDNSAAIQEQAASSSIGVEQLQAAFANIYATMDSIDEFKVKALDTMAATIGVLENEVEKSKAYVARVQSQDQRRPAASSTSTTSVARPGPRSGSRGLLGLADGKVAPQEGRPRDGPALPRPRPTSWPRWRGSRRCSPTAPPPRSCAPGSPGSTARSARRCPSCRSWAGGAADAYAVVATATDYLPEAVGGYLRLPRDWANSRPIEGGKTALMVLVDQLELLASTMTKMLDAANRADAEALIAHGRFLEAKFGHASLRRHPRRRPGRTRSTTPAPLDPRPGVTRDAC